MPESPPADHDQRLKVLLKELFDQFFRCFFPSWADRFDFGDRPVQQSRADREEFAQAFRNEQRLRLAAPVAGVD